MGGQCTRKQRRRKAATDGSGASLENQNRAQREERRDMLTGRSSLASKSRAFITIAPGARVRCRAATRSAIASVRRKSSPSKEDAPRR